jgi:hypothetical protein
MRKPTQIAVFGETDITHGAIYALCDDASIWVLSTRGGAEWQELPPITDESDRVDTNLAADEAHMERIHAEIVEDMRDARESVHDVDGIVSAIAVGRIRHLTINY